MSTVVWYSGNPSIRRGQIKDDLFTALRALFWLNVGWTAYTLVAALREPLREVERLVRTFESGLEDLTRDIALTPILGPELAGTLGRLSAVGSRLGESTAGLAAGIGQLAFAFALITSVPPLMGALLPWAVRKRRFRADAALVRQLYAAGAHDLLAFRALASRPLAELAILGDSVTEWRRGDDTARAELVRLELTAFGLARPVRQWPSEDPIRKKVNS